MSKTHEGETEHLKKIKEDEIKLLARLRKKENIN